MMANERDSDLVLRTLKAGANAVTGFHGAAQRVDARIDALAAREHPLQERAMDVVDGVADRAGEYGRVGSTVKFLLIALGLVVVMSPQIAVKLVQACLQLAYWLGVLYAVGATFGLPVAAVWGVQTGAVVTAAVPVAIMCLGVFGAICAIDQM